MLLFRLLGIINRKHVLSPIGKILNLSTGSLVAASWRNMMEEMDNTAKLIRQNADSIESKSLDALNALYAEKRKARKSYQEEHARILQQFTHVSIKI